MKALIAVALLASLTGQVAGGAGEIRYLRRSAIFGIPYEQTVFASDLEGCPTFDVEGHDPPLRVKDASGIARRWMEAEFGLRPSWIEEPVWNLIVVAISRVGDTEHWIYEVEFALGFPGGRKMVGDRFRAVVLMDGTVVEPVFGETPDESGYPAPPPPIQELNSADYLVTLSFVDAPLERLLDLYAEISGWRVSESLGMSEPGIHHSVNMKIGRKITPDKALGIIEDYLRAHSIALEEKGDGELAARLWWPGSPSKRAR